MKETEIPRTRFEEREPSSGRNPRAKRSRAFVWVTIGVALFALFWFTQGSGDHERPAVPYSTFLDLTEQGKVDRVTLRGDEVTVELASAQSIAGRRTTS